MKVKCLICNAILSDENPSPYILRKVAMFDAAAKLLRNDERGNAMVEVIKDHMVTHAQAPANV